MSFTRRSSIDFPKFIFHELGSSNQPLTFLHKLVVRPLCQPSFPGFWRDWNPAYRYFLALYFFRPLHKLFPRWLALLLTFFACGLLLHDVPFVNGFKWLRGQLALPTGAILFSIFGLMTLMSESLKLDLSAYPVVIRAAANVGWLVSGFALCRLVIELL